VRITAAFTLLIISYVASAQTFRVSGPKRAFYADGREIQHGDSIGVNTRFVLGKKGKKGKVSFALKNRWYFSVEGLGRYKMDSLVAREVRMKEYRKHDSVFNVMASNKVEKCLAIVHCGTCEGPHSAKFHSDRVELIGEHRDVTTPSVKLEWTYLSAFNERYFVVIKDMSERYIDVRITTDKFLDLDLRQYQDLDWPGLIIYKVISEECKDSQEKLITFK
jgi:hypothetical protein